ncbi:late competence protein ComER [Mechercharimyces sp. CAU 1602]|uniref:late competence protein ComER n=1 Tax=Mechercharimyces sp. CAU 1602 TaxID=2973933 RepID=UPI0021639E6C|nr:late competence protein ComER [Mechercharimyces sp. CAU 1602]MCS1350409.1 late competence protein ComER [Mechercharimyces sp. CAU 1602]
MNIGFIGTGSMGTMLVESFIEAEALQPSEIMVYNRTPAKAHKLVEAHPGIQMASSNAQISQQCPCLFLCIKPKEYRTVIEEIHSYIQPAQMVISITSPVLIEDLEKYLRAKIAKVIPSITHAGLSGASLYIPGTRLTEADEIFLHNLMSKISTPLPVDENYTRIASDLASCAPAFISNIFQQLIEAAVKETGLPREVATPLVIHMASGVGTLLAQGKFSLKGLEKRVAVPGGITKEGLKRLESQFVPVFRDLFHITHKKYGQDISEVKAMFEKMHVEQ